VGLTGDETHDRTTRNPPRVTPRHRSIIRFDAHVAPRRRLFCIPFAGGGPATYRLWPRYLPDDVEVLALQLPGRNPLSREPMLDSVTAIVDVLHDAVLAHADLPYAIFGHSMGALLGFELTVSLEASGSRPPSHLFVSGRRAPDEPLSAPPIHALPDDEFLDALHGSYGGVPDVVRNEPDLLALLLPALRADVRTLETYAPTAARKVACEVHVYGGTTDTHPCPAALDGWQRVAERAISVRLFDGDHFYLAGDSRASLLADIAERWAVPRASVASP
jgi:surfactin synthase thioesterase subunit